MTDLTPEQRMALADALTISWPMPARVDDVTPVIARLLADERERIAREIESLDYEHHSPLGSIFKHPNEMKREAARIARGQA